MSSVLLLEIRIPRDQWDGATDAHVRAAWVKQRGYVVSADGRPDLVYSDAENAIDAAFRAARRILRRERES